MKITCKVVVMLFLVLVYSFNSLTYAQNLPEEEETMAAQNSLIDSGYVKITNGAIIANELLIIKVMMAEQELYEYYIEDEFWSNWLPGVLGKEAASEIANLIILMQGVHAASALKTALSDGEYFKKLVMKAQCALYAKNTGGLCKVPINDPYLNEETIVRPPSMQIDDLNAKLPINSNAVLTPNMVYNMNISNETKDYLLAMLNLFAPYSNIQLRLNNSTQEVELASIYMSNGKAQNSVLTNATYIDMQGNSRTYIALSGATNNNPPFLKNALQIPTVNNGSGKFLQPFEELGLNSYLSPRMVNGHITYYDAEVTVNDHFIKDIKPDAVIDGHTSYPGITGVLFTSTTRTTCFSCVNLTTQLATAFPDMYIVVYVSPYVRQNDWFKDVYKPFKGLK